MIRCIVEEEARNKVHGIIHKDIINQRRRVIGISIPFYFQIKKRQVQIIKGHIQI